MVLGAGGVGAVRGGDLKKKRLEGGWGEGAVLPPRCIADDHDGGLCFEPVVVVVVVVAAAAAVVVVVGDIVDGAKCWWC